jgi:hypothetical protein
MQDQGERQRKQGGCRTRKHGMGLSPGDEGSEPLDQQGVVHGEAG